MNILTLGTLLLIGGKVQFNTTLIIFILSGFASLLFNKIPSLFQAPQRFTAFVIISSLVGPLITSKSLNLYRFYLFNYILKTINILVIISFFAYLLRLPIIAGRGGITGLFNHSMLLGPVSAISMLYNLHLFLKVSQRRKKYVFLSGIVISFLMALIAGSRISIAGGLIGAVFMFYKITGNSFLRFSRVLILFIIVLVFSFPLWRSYTKTIVGKTQYGQEQSGSITYSREHLWKLRLQEFNNSPLYGIGFATVDLKTNYAVNTESGTIEPGSSWLVLLSMLGLWGFIPFAIFVISNLWFSYANRRYLLNNAFFGGLIAFFIFHLIAEGYIIAAGSAMFYIFWLFLGNASQFKDICLQRKVNR